MKFVQLFILSLVVLVSGCNERNQSVVPELFTDTSSLFLKVYEDSMKNIFLNGHPIAKKELEVRLIRLKKKGGIVFYSCYNATEDPPANSTTIELVKEYRLPLKMFTDSTFTRAFY